MALPTSEPEMWDLNLFRDDDDEEEIYYKNLFQALATGDKTSAEAAAELNNYLVHEANLRWEATLKRPDPRNTTEEEEMQGRGIYTLVPNTSGHLNWIFRSIFTKLFSVFLPYSAGQDRIVGFLETLRAMPKRVLPDGIPSENINKNEHVITLWEFGDNWIGLVEEIRIAADEFPNRWSGIKAINSETRIRWRNFQSMIARLTVLDLFDCGFLCALSDVLRKIEAANEVDADVISGGQWIIWPNECRYVYQQCKKVDKIEGPRTMWSMERWKLWKNQFARIAHDERYHSESKFVARLASQQMAVVELETPLLNEVSKFCDP